MVGVSAAIPHNFMWNKQQPLNRSHTAREHLSSTEVCLNTFGCLYRMDPKCHTLHASGLSSVRQPPALRMIHLACGVKTGSSGMGKLFCEAAAGTAHKQHKVFHVVYQIDWGSAQIAHSLPQAVRADTMPLVMAHGPGAMSSRLMLPCSHVFENTRVVHHCAKKLLVLGSRRLEAWRCKRTRRLPHPNAEAQLRNDHAEPRSAKC